MHPTSRQSAKLCTIYTCKKLPNIHAKQPNTIKNPIIKVELNSKLNNASKDEQTTFYCTSKGLQNKRGSDDHMEMWSSKT